MASAEVQHPQGASGLFQVPSSSQNFTAPKVASSNAQYKPRNVVGVLNYFKDNEDGSPPAPSYTNKPESYERPTLPKEVTIHDIRGFEDKYTLDTIGFQVVAHEAQEKEFVNEERIKNTYYKEIEELLKKTTGASKVFIFDHTIRRQPKDTRTPAQVQAGEPAPARNTLRGPVQRVHIDQSYSAGRGRVSHHLPDEAETLLKGRYQIINVWRPIKTILKDPLTIAAANSVSDDDLVPIKLIYPDREGETYAVRPGSGHQWHYLFQQTPGEVLLIKCFDSKTDGRARRVPHSSFVDGEFENEEPRESIEIRALVFHPDDTE